MRSWLSCHLLFSLMIVGGLSFGLSTHAVAQTLLDTAISTSIGGHNTIGSITPPPPIATIVQDLLAQGFTNISSLAPTPIGTPMHATAMSPAGIPVNLVIDPQTGKLLAATPQ